jgi:predicted XRE-type DNA-binding protein
MKGVTKSTGNVFADAGLPDSDTLLAKAELTRRISKAIEELNLTQVEVAARTGIDQPKISMLLRGRFEGYSLERLFRFLNALDQDVRISTRPTKNRRARLAIK